MRSFHYYFLTKKKTKNSWNGFKYLYRLWRAIINFEISNHGPKFNDENDRKESENCDRIVAEHFPITSAKITEGAEFQGEN